MVHGSWTEELPHDLEQLSEAGETLGGRLSDGRRVAARMVLAGSSDEKRRLVERLRRAAVLTDSHLVPVLGAAAEQNAIWALSELDSGVPVRELRSAGPLSPALAVSVAVGALAGLAALHRAELAHGSLDEGSVRVAADGRVRLAGAAIAAGDARGDLTALGALLCAALDVPERPDDELRPAERSMPALVATARTMAAGRYGSADAALVAVRSAADRLARAADSDRRREVAPPPAEEPAPAPVPAAASRPRPPARSPVLLAALLLAAIALGGLGVVLGAATAHRTAPARSARASLPAPDATATPEQPAAPATPEASPPDVAPPPTAAPAAPSPSQPDAPDAAVSRFYQLVQEHRFDDALALWSPRMRATYPPGENLYQRFADTTSIYPVSDRVTQPGDGSAVVAVDVIEVRGGRTYHWVGSWYLVRGSGWQLDQPALRPA
ncbi:MAG TPA: hypothetical protein VIC57_06690 [Candidatus Dormibacteraeota bacterium]